MDAENIRTEVFKRTGIAIANDDPFSVVIEALSITTENIDQKNVAAIKELRKIRDDIVMAKVKRHSSNIIEITIIAVLAFILGIFLGIQIHF